MVRSGIGLALLSVVLAAPARGEDEAVVEILHAAGTESATGIELQVVSSARDPESAARLARVLERLREWAGKAGASVRVEATAIDLSRPQGAEEERLLAGIRVLRRRLRFQGEEYDWPYLAHLVLSTDRGSGSLELPGVLEGDLPFEVARLVARVALGHRPRFALVSSGLDPAAVLAGLGRALGPGVDVVPVDPSAPDAGWLDGLVVAAASPLPDPALAYVRESLAIGRPVALFLDPVAGALDRLAPVESGLEPELALRGIRLPLEVLLDPASGGRIDAVVTRPGGDPRPERLVAAHEIAGFSLCGPLEVDPASLEAAGWRVVETLAAPRTARRLALAESSSLAEILLSAERAGAAANSAIALRLAGAWKEGGQAGAVLLVRDADFLASGSGARSTALAPLLARFAWDPARIRAALARKRRLLPALDPGEVDFVRIGDAFELVREGDSWIAWTADGRRLLADGARVRALLESLADRWRGEPAPDPGRCAAEVEVRGDAVQATARVAPAEAPVEPGAWVDLRPLDLAPEEIRSLRLPGIALGEIGGEWRLGSFDSARYVPGDPADSRKVAEIVRALSSAQTQLGLVDAHAITGEPLPESLAQLGLPAPDERILAVARSGRFQVLHLAGDVVYAARGPRLVAWRLPPDASRLVRAGAEAFRLEPSPKFVRIRQIVLPMEEEARAALDEIRGGADFGRVAARATKDPFEADLGRIGRGDLDPELEKVAFSLAVGETSEIVRTPFGFHIIQRVE